MWIEPGPKIEHFGGANTRRPDMSGCAGFLDPDGISFHTVLIVTKSPAKAGSASREVGDPVGGFDRRPRRARMIRR